MGDVPEAQAAVLAFKAADRDLKNKINTATRTTMGPVWKSLVDQYATHPLDRRVIATGARIASGNPPTAVAATSKRKLSGGLSPADQWAPIEFGAHRNTTTTYTRKNRRNGGTHRVTRHAKRQLPDRRPSGRVAFRAMRDLGPRLGSLWVQLIVKTYNDAAQGK